MTSNVHALIREQDKVSDVMLLWEKRHSEQMQKESCFVYSCNSVCMSIPLPELLKKLSQSKYFLWGASGGEGGVEVSVDLLKIKLLLFLYLSTLSLWPRPSFERESVCSDPAYIVIMLIHLF